MNLYYNEEVSAALAKNKPVVALESTIISHGMPYPQNLETALAVEADVREAGAVPATIAILEGQLRVGLSPSELSALAQAKDVAKVSRRDLPVIVAQGRWGATTVATTMILAAMAGIRVFATGGIGGVHRGAERTMDISADLQELARTDVAVVCAGAKAILDLPLTLEYLETFGVPVLGYKTDEFPAFFSRESGLSVDARVDTPEDAARIMRAKWDMGLSGGLLIANPVPAEWSMDKASVDSAVAQALEAAREAGIFGREVTPFLLKKVKELTGGESLEANIALVRNNARLAGQVAAAFGALG